MIKFCAIIILSLMITSCSLGSNGDNEPMYNHSGSALSGSSIDMTGVVTPTFTGAKNIEEKEEVIEHDLFLTGGRDPSGSNTEGSLLEMDTLLEKK